MALKPDYARAHSNRGLTLGNLCRFQEALLSISPRYLVSPSRPASAMATACFFFAVSIPTKTSLYFSVVRPSCVEALLGPPEQPSCALWHVGAGRLASVDHGHNV